MTEVKVAEQNTELKGLDGWLILVGISVIITPLRLLSNFISEVQLVWSTVTWDYLFNPQTALNFRLTSYLLVFELTYGTVLMALLLVQIYLFFTKHKKFPVFFIAVLCLFLVFKPIDSLLVHFVFADDTLFDLDGVLSYLYNSIYAIIWIPYMLRSKRVKNTFVV